MADSVRQPVTPAQTGAPLPTASPLQVIVYHKKTHKPLKVFPIDAKELTASHHDEDGNVIPAEYTYEEPKGVAKADDAGKHTTVEPKK
jgi:hypothetical protein